MIWNLTYFLTSWLWTLISYQEIYIDMLVNICFAIAVFALLWKHDHLQLGNNLHRFVNICIHSEIRIIYSDEYGLHNNQLLCS